MAGQVDGGMRLFSNLVLTDDGLRHEPGRFWGSTALIAGTTVGAGVLALPAVTFPMGVIPSSVFLVGVWLYALVAALLLVEVNVQTLCILGRSRLGLLGMVQVVLGKPAARLTGVAYLFLHYALLVAYVAQGGSVLTDVLAGVVPLSSGIGVGLFTLIGGGGLMVCPNRWVQEINQVLVLVVIGAFVGLLGLGSQAADPGNWTAGCWGAATPAIAIMLVTLFYHNVIPIVTTQLEGDLGKIRRAITLGSAIPLLLFLLWNALMLAALSPEMVYQLETGAVFDPLVILRRGAAGPALGILITVFSEAAIATSFIGVTYGLLDLFADLAPPHTTRRPWLRYLLVFVPTASLALLDPEIFFTALDAVGTFSVSTLSGILPAVMAGQLRRTHSNTASTAVSGGQLSLFTIIGLSVGIILTHLPHA